MDPELLQWAASLGVGGVLAAGVFVVYRRDSKEWQERWRGQSDVLLRVVQDNTKAVTELTVLIERMNGKHS